MKTLIAIVFIIAVIAFFTALWKLLHDGFVSFIRNVFIFLITSLILIVVWRLIWIDAKPRENQPYLDYIKSGNAIKKENSLPNRKDSQGLYDTRRSSNKSQIRP